MKQNFDKLIAGYRLGAAGKSFDKLLAISSKFSTVKLLHYTLCIIIYVPMYALWYALWYAHRYLHTITCVCISFQRG